MSALLYWTCGKEMADMLLANGDAKEAEKLKCMRNLKAIFH